MFHFRGIRPMTKKAFQKLGQNENALWHFELLWNRAADKQPPPENRVSFHNISVYLKLMNG